MIYKRFGDYSISVHDGAAGASLSVQIRLV